MIKKLSVQNSRGRIVCTQGYHDMDEMMKDLRILMKPSMFGGKGFQIVVQECEQGDAYDW